MYKKYLFIVTFALLIFVGISGVSPNSLSADTTVSGTISATTTWTTAGNVYIVDGTLIINSGVTLTIDPGVIVKFKTTNSSISVNGTLNAQGTSGNPIYFTSYKDDSVGGDTNGDGSATSPAPGDWQHIWLNSSGTTVNLSHTIILYGGGSISSAQQANIYVNSGTLTTSTSTIAYANTYGIRAGGGTVHVVDSEFIENPYALYIVDPDILATDSGNTETSSNATHNKVYITGTLNNNRTWPLRSVPYIIGNIIISSGVTLTISPGTILKFENANSGISVNNNGTLNAQGSSLYPIYFTSLKDDSIGDDTNGDGSATSPSPGDWQYVYLDSSNSVVNLGHAIVRYGGGSAVSVLRANIYKNNGTLTISTSTISHGHTYGIRQGAGTTTISQSIIRDNGSYGAYNALTSTSTFSAINNYWGSPSGPYHPTLNPTGTGDEVTNYISFDPWLEDASCVTNCYSNIMFLPGIMGSDLYDTANTNTCWPGFVGDFDAEYNCILMTSTSTPNQSDVVTRKVIEEVPIPLLPNFDVYEQLIEDMEDWQATYSITATSTPYDWRYDFDHIVKAGTTTAHGISYEDYLAPDMGYLEAKLLNLASTSNTGKVTIVAHSMGGLVAKELLNKIGSASTTQMVDKLILVASPQLGTPKAVGTILHGTESGFPLSILSEKQARGLSQNMQSVFNLLPSEKYFDSVSDPVITFSTSTSLYEDMISNYGQAISSWNDLAGYMQDAKWGVPDFDDLKTPQVASSTILTRAEDVHDNLDNWMPPGGVELITIAGWGLNTLSRIHYLDDDGVDLSPHHVIDGDETVVVPSALFSSGQGGVERYWVDIYQYNSDDTFCLINCKRHSNILEIESLRKLIRNKIIGVSESLSYIHTSTSTLSSPSGTQLHFVLHSPLTLGYRDSNGRYTGLKEDGKVEISIPNSQYERYGEVQWLSVPASAGGSLEMISIDDGRFTLEVREKQGNDLIKQVNFVRVPTEKDMRVTLGFIPRSVAPISEDLELSIIRRGGETEKVKTWEREVREVEQRKEEKDSDVMDFEIDIGEETNE